MLTAARLRWAKACGPQVEVFEREWPKGCRITPATIARAVELGLSVGWAGAHAPGLALAERRKLIAKSYNPSYWLAEAAAYAPGLTARQREQLQAEAVCS